jgi:hypothetical protein
MPKHGQHAQIPSYSRQPFPNHWVPGVTSCVSATGESLRDTRSLLPVPRKSRETCWELLGGAGNPGPGRLRSPVGLLT